jgi:hypothetical protein
MAQRAPVGAGKHWPVAAQPADSRKPQIAPPTQSALLVQVPVGPASGGGAHWHVSHPLLSLRTPFAHCGRQPKAGHARPASSGQAGKPQSHRPLVWRVQSVALTLDPSGHRNASAGAARPAQSAGVQSAAASLPLSGAPGPPDVTSPLHPPPPAPVNMATANQTADAYGRRLLGRRCIMFLISLDERLGSCSSHASCRASLRAVSRRVARDFSHSGQS